MDNFYLDVSSLLETFKVTDITVYPKAEKDTYEHGHHVRKYLEPESREEPFIPNSLNTYRSIVQLRLEQGNTKEYNAIWISSGTYAVDTLVKHKDKVYRVNEIKDLSDYSNATFYYLIGEDDLDVDQL
jgi:hypothetical protein